MFELDGGSKFHSGVVAQGSEGEKNLENSSYSKAELQRAINEWCIFLRTLRVDEL